MSMKTISSHRFSFIAGVGLLVVEFACLLMAFAIPTKAANVYLKDIRAKGTQMSSEYAFSPTISSQTDIQVIDYSGCNYYDNVNQNNFTGDPKEKTGPKPADIVDNEFEIKPTDTTGNMSITLRYTNVGFDVNGKAIDADVTVATLGVKSWATISPVGFVEMATTGIGDAYLMNASVTMKFLTHDSHSPANVSGHLTFANVNSVKHVHISRDMFNAIYCDPASEIYDLNNNTSEYELTAQNNTKDKDTVKFTGTFKNKSQLSYSFNQAGWYKVKAGFEMGSLVDVEIPGPNKSGVDDTSKKKLQGLMPKSIQSPIQVKNEYTPTLSPRSWEIPNLAPANKQANNVQQQIQVPKLSPRGANNGDDIWKLRPLYTIFQIMPSKSAGYLSSYSITDNLDPYWTMTPPDKPTGTVDVSSSLIITDENGKSKNSYFTATVDSTNKLTIAATTAALADKGFYNHVYNFVIKGSFVRTVDNKFPEKLPLTLNYATKDNTATASYQVAGTNKKVNNSATANDQKIKYPDLPTVKVNDVFGDKETLKGTVNDALTHSGDTNYLDMKITYTNNQGNSVTAPLKLKSSSPSQPNRLDNPNPGTDINFEAELPNDIQKVTDDSNYAQPLTITATDNYDISGQGIAKIKTWWNLDNSGTLTIYSHTINYPYDGSTNAAPWPWLNAAGSVKKVVFEGVVTNTKGASLQNMFAHMSGLKTIENLDNFHVDHPGSTRAMFWGTGLTSLDISHFDMRGVQDTTSMLSSDTNPNTNKLSQLTLGANNYFPKDPGLVASYKDTNYGQTDNDIPVKWREDITGEDDNHANKFYDSSISQSGLIGLYSNGKSLSGTRTFIRDDDWWNLDNSGTLTIYKHAIDLNITSYRDWPWSNDTGKVKTVDIQEGVKINTCAAMFMYMTKLNQINGLKNLDTSQVKDMSNMFQFDYALTQLDLKDLKTPNVTDFTEMFKQCIGLQTLDMSTVDMSKAADNGKSNGTTSTNTATTDMFSRDSQLKELTLGDKTKFLESPAIPTPPADSLNHAQNWSALSDGKTYTSNALEKLYDNQFGPKDTYTWENDWWNIDNNKLTIYPHNIKYQTILNRPVKSVDWPWYQDPATNPSPVTSIEIKPGVTTDTTAGMFMSMPKLTSITGLGNLDTSSVTDMSDMFYGDISLTGAGLSDLDQLKTENVTNMSGMFRYCYALDNPNLSNFKTSNVTNMSNMFQGGDKIHPNTPNPDPNNPKDYNGTDLKTLDISSFDMSHVSNTSNMFGSNKNLQQLTLGAKTYFATDPKLTSATVDHNTGHNTEKWQAVGSGTIDNPLGEVLAAKDLTDKYNKVPTSSAPNPAETYVWDKSWWVIDNNVLSIYKHTIDYNVNNGVPTWPWASQASNLTGVVFKGDVTTASNTTLQNMFAHMSKVTSITDLNKLDTANAVNMHGMFYDTGLTNLDISNFDMSQVTDTGDMFNDSSNLNKITLGKNNKFITVNQDPRLIPARWREDIAGQDDNHAEHIYDSVEVIGLCSNNNTISSTRTFVRDDSWWNVDRQNKLTIYPHKIDLQASLKRPVNSSDWPWYQDPKVNPSPVTSIEIKSGVTTDTTAGMFMSMPKLTSITGLGNLNTSSVTDMSDMFQGDTSLTGTSFSDLDQLNTENVTNMSGMFKYCYKLDKLDISSFDMGNVQSSDGMFLGSNNLQQLTLGANTYFATDPNLTKADTSKGPNTEKWQAVGSGTVTNPAGDALTANDIYNNYHKNKTGNLKETYVWDTRWWDVTDDGILKIYQHEIDYPYVDANHAPAWPWDPKQHVQEFRDTIKKAEIIGKVTTATNSTLQNMFAHMHNMTSITGLKNIDTENVLSMRSMFWGTGLQTIDISSFNMKNVKDTQDMVSKDDLMKKPTLWKITIGPNFKAQANSKWFDPAPSDDTPIPGDGKNVPDGMFVSRSVKWQEVGDGSDYHPNGSTYTAQDLNSMTSDGKNHTYVWQPFEAGYLTLMNWPKNLKYKGFNNPLINPLQFTADSQFKVEDTRHIHNDWKLMASMDKGLKANGTPLNFEVNANNNNYNYTSPFPVGDSNSITKIDKSNNGPKVWDYEFNNPIQLNVLSTPAPGTYKGKIEYTLVDSLQ
ncbi:BspA family leucine-rich repeat surface protein [Bombilactobacillus bombi]|uniref:BspA family leucine-rich repeat surface protein n=1 Tax=Bombilactobacillus bombi TaxID=1303590 RepID=UPI0015E5F218|nr:BspA family leucine-rich repeat surface protein [Bombilactobacillus bombi]MBA1434213.1 BspA family leucine-rich repeat surface protein [Bombilactobacillus bombi]